MGPRSRDAACQRVPGPGQSERGHCHLRPVPQVTVWHHGDSRDTRLGHGGHSRGFPSVRAHHPEEVCPLWWGDHRPRMSEPGARE